jgi:hypothetical protein
MTSVFASGADAQYGYQLLNLLGSLHANSDVFDRVVVYDLGLTPHQRELLDAVRDVEVRTVPPFAPHWSQGFAWKPWVWTHLNTRDVVFWLDAGATLLRSLEPALDQIRDRGYFVVSQGGRLAEIVPRDYYELYDFARERAGQPYVAAGIMGFRVGSEFYERVVVPTYEDCLAGRSVGFSPQEEPFLNRGLQRTAVPTLRDCLHFRWDQTVFNLRLFGAYPEPFVNDLWEYAGFRSKRDHPQQVIWSHRRRGPLTYLTRVPYEGRAALSGRAFGALYRVRWWKRLHAHLFDATTYRLKLQKLARELRRDPPPSAPS